MEFIQKKKANKHTFTLHDDYFSALSGVYTVGGGKSNSA